MTALAPYLSAFLREHLPRERNASPHTVATYAHCLRYWFGSQPDNLAASPAISKSRILIRIWC